METLDRTKIESALYNADLTDENLYEDYSGRAMYGDKCFGVTGSESQTTMFLIELASEDVDLARELARAQRSDSMGMDMIAYFPGFTVAKVGE